MYYSRGVNRLESPKHKSGDIIIANWTSYIDIIYLACKLDPVFTQIYTGTDKVKVISLWEAIVLVGKIPAVEPEKDEKVYSVKELSLKAKKPIVIFAEVRLCNIKGKTEINILF